MHWVLIRLAIDKEVSQRKHRIEDNASVDTRVALHCTVAISLDCKVCLCVDLDRGAGAHSAGSREHDP